MELSYWEICASDKWIIIISFNDLIFVISLEYDLNWCLTLKWDTILNLKLIPDVYVLWVKFHTFIETICFLFIRLDFIQSYAQLRMLTRFSFSMRRFISTESIALLRSKRLPFGHCLLFSDSWMKVYSRDGDITAVFIDPVFLKTVLLLVY